MPTNIEAIFFFSFRKLKYNNIIKRSALMYVPMSIYHINETTEKSPSKE